MKKQEDYSREIAEIQRIKSQLGEKLLILTHHYQRREIVELGDYRGDSFGLSQRAAADAKARHIVFCGVHFMAESAEILSGPHQTVQLPDKEAGCWMADMADSYVVERSWQEATKVLGENVITPIVYMNADASIKAFCGRHGGLVCTSSNAPAAFAWGLERREKVFFFPDQHLGGNTGHQMGFSPEDMIVWDPSKPLGGVSAESLKRARILLWDGYCLVHTRFQVAHIEAMRERYPEAKIVVHPECLREVVQMADAAGSTDFIVKYVRKASPGATIIIGTEINLVKRLGAENPDKNILTLHDSLCPNMYKINPRNLLLSLRHIGKKNVIHVSESIKKEAGVALERMLAL